VCVRGDRGGGMYVFVRVCGCGCGVRREGLVVL